MAKFEAIIPVGSAGLAGQAEFVKDRVHKIAGAIAGKWTACAVCSVSARREAEDQNSGAWVAEARNRTRPVGLVRVGATFGLADALTIFA